MEAFLSLNQGVIPAIVGLLGLGGTAASSLRFVHEGERGLKLLFGKVRRDSKGDPVLVEPGWCWIWPGAEKLLKVHVRHDTINLVDQFVTLADGTAFRMSAALTFYVDPSPGAVYRILIETQDFRRSFADYALGVFRAEVGGKTWSEVVGKAEDINVALTDVVRRRSEEWGAVVTEFSLTDCQPVGATAQTIQVISATVQRAEALVYAAKGLGVPPADVPPQLAAALIGVPLVVSIGSAPTENVAPEDGVSEDPE